MDDRPMKSSEWVMNDIKKKITQGQLSPGDRLASVVDLALQYSVGRSTVREALSALKAMGMLDIKQGGGTFVKAPPAESQPMHPGQLYQDLWEGRAASLRHVLEVRRVLETGCALLAAGNRTESDLSALSETLQSMEHNLENESLNEQADVRFHQQIAAATHNPLLGELMESLSQKLHDSIKDMRALWFYAERSSSERLLREHYAIYEAIKDGNAKEASARMGLHITKVEQVLDGKVAMHKPL
ncbi:FadR/GntR family transcriptional regulator [Paenibacillus abyssi]|nr:FadR/GntR family transcriptional regulator [Paenibacillus abyssi]